MSTKPESDARLAPATGSAKLSAKSKDALIWLACSEEAGELTCKEARERLAKHFGTEVATEIESFLSPNDKAEPTGEKP
ncbi:MAG: hypothetical protein DME22_23045 [Verrucomicrobia bacterium]|nr:MAG: hypothetical protein DME22_23045 [Verrucomicrobiota bacterium]